MAEDTQSLNTEGNTLLSLLFRDRRLADSLALGVERGEEVLMLPILLTEMKEEDQLLRC